MSDLTMTARAKLAEPPRLFQIEEAIREHIAHLLICCRHGVPDANITPMSEDRAKRIVERLLDLHLIGLPAGNAARTSVDAGLVAQLGKKLACRTGDDADDVLKTAIRVGRVVG